MKHNTKNTVNIFIIFPLKLRYDFENHFRSAVWLGKLWKESIQSLHFMSLPYVFTIQINNRFIKEKVNCVKCVVVNTYVCVCCLCLAANELTLLKWFWSLFVRSIGVKRKSLWPKHTTDIIVRGNLYYFAIISINKYQTLLFSVILLLLKFSLVNIPNSLHKSLVELNLLSYGMV